MNFVNKMQVKRKIIQLNYCVILQFKKSARTVLNNVKCIYGLHLLLYVTDDIRLQMFICNSHYIVRKAVNDKKIHNV